MEYNHIVLVSDMDDTLLNSKKSISESNLQAIHSFQQKGGKFTVATGRSISGFRPYWEQLKIAMPVILCNGSCIYDYKSEKVVWVKELPENMKDYVRKVISHFSNLGVQIMSESGIYSYHSTPVCLAFMERENLPFFEIDDFSVIPDKWIKVEMVTDLIDKQKLDFYLKETLPKGCRWLTTGEYSREIMAEGVSKRAALEKLLEIAGMQENKICCIGDHNNDYEMICGADIGLAVNNALDKIKDKADIIVSDNDHDAIAEAIRCIG